MFYANAAFLRTLLGSIAHDLFIEPVKILKLILDGNFQQVDIGLFSFFGCTLLLALLAMVFVSTVKSIATVLFFFKERKAEELRNIKKREKERHLEYSESNRIFDEMYERYVGKDA